MNNQASVNSRCAVLNLGDVYKKGQRDYITVGVKLGNAMVTAGECVAHVTLTAILEWGGHGNATLGCDRVWVGGLQVVWVIVVLLFVFSYFLFLASVAVSCTCSLQIFAAGMVAAGTSC